MKAIVIEPNKDLVWKDVPNPVLAVGEVLVEIHAAAVNRSPVAKKAMIFENFVKDIWPKVESGEVRPTIYKVLYIQEPEAVQLT